MFKHVVSLRLKPAVTTAHGHTVGADALRIDGDDKITKVVGPHSHLATGATPYVLFVGLAFLWQRQVTIDVDRLRLTIVR